MINTYHVPVASATAQATKTANCGLDMENMLGAMAKSNLVEPHR